MSWKTCLNRYTNQITFLLLSLTEFIQLAFNITTTYMAKNIRRHNGCTSYIYIYIYILLKYGGSATKHKLYDQIGAKSSNYWKIDIFSQSENVSVYL